jgi:hypothetical protein
MSRTTRCRWIHPTRSVDTVEKKNANRGIRALRIAAVLALVAVPTIVLPALAPAASVASLTLSGGPGTLTVGGALYAKAGAVVGVDAATSADAQCVRLFENGAPIGSQSNAAGSSAWHFDLTVPNATGFQQVRATAYATSDCHGAWGSATGGFFADSSGPRISPLVSPAPNVYGWNNSSVTITARTNDGGLVGVDASSIGPRLTRLGNETSGTPVDIAASDLLGNRTLTSLTIRIDKTPPTVSVSGVVNGANYILNGVPPAGCLASDALSGIDSCTGHAPGGVGMRTYNADAFDRAGNSASAHVTYHVSYDFRWAGTNPTSGRAGSPITFRVQLLDATGAVVQAGSAPTVVGGTGTVTWNATTHRYVVTETPDGSAGAHATVGVHLDDGTEHTFVVALT